MRKTERQTAGTIVLTIVIALFALLVLFPFYLVVVNSVKTNAQITQSLLSFPVEFHWENFPAAMEKMNFTRAFANSIFVTVFSVAGLILISSMTAYQTVRRKNIVSKLIFVLIVASMAIPFQVLMVPSVIVATKLGVMNSLPGIVLIYWGFLLPMAMFLYQGFIKGVPRELEEAALIDGCGQIRTFFRIVFPLLKPITATVAIINIMGVFNDFSLPLVMLSRKELKTLPLSFSVFYSSYLNDWALILAALLLTVVPVLLFFLIMQRHIMSGLTSGAIKG